MTITPQAALALGWSVIPINRTKKPMLSSWKPYQSRKPTEEEIADWAKLNPPAWALITGQFSNRITFDFDGEEGLKLAQQWGIKPHRRTGRGGLHWDVEHPGWPVPTLNGKAQKELGIRFPGLDIKGDGGYVVFCGRSEFGTYEWLRDDTVADPPELVPQAVWEFLRHVASGSAPNGYHPPVSAFRIEDFFARHGIAAREIEAYQGSRRWLLAVCPWAGAHTTPRAATEAAVFEQRDGKLGFKCQHAHCADKQWTDFREYYEPGYKAHQEEWTGETPRAWTETSTMSPAPDEGPPYPKPIGAASYIGIAGAFVGAVEPHTEADPNFLLLQFLTYAGNAFGRQAFIYVSGDRHHTNLFICGVGPTSTGRKGSARAPVETFFRDMDDDWAGRWTGGLSSGEGLIWAVRDPVFKSVPPAKKGQAQPGEPECTDRGVTDKRLVVRQPEFAGALRVMRRDGNTLSPTVRDAWDTGMLNTMVKNSPNRATNAHISIIGNITKEELLVSLEGEVDNGLANRFLWCMSIRSKLLPEGGREFTELEEFGDAQKRFNQIHYEVNGGITRDTEASDLWGYNTDPTHGAYCELTREKGGMWGKATSRATAQVLRMALIYALLDGSRHILRHHLDAALEVWRYCDESACYIFGDRSGNLTADTILEALRQTPEGLTRAEINHLFGRHKASSEITVALELLQRSGKAHPEKEDTRGRTAERWRLTP